MYVLCITYCLVSHSGDSVSGEETTYMESNTIAGSVENLIRFITADHPYGQTLQIMDWSIAEVIYTQSDCIDE